MVSITILETPVSPAIEGKKRQLESVRLSTTPPATPTALSTSVQQLFSQIGDIYEELSCLDNVSPGERVNGLLTRLVGLCVQPYGSEFEACFLAIEGVQELCASLQSICARAEGELESYWARRILEGSQASIEKDSDPRNLLNQFPYYTNYIDLSRLETSLLRAFLPSSTTLGISPLNIAFIGSGPLPLTSFCLLDIIPNAKIYNIDRDEPALKISSELSETVGFGKSMKFACEDVSVDGVDKTKSVEWEEMDVVFLAALVGMDTATKLGILESLARKLRPGTLVAARSARGLRTVLYPVLELSDDLSRLGYDVLAELHPHTDVVNSIIVLRVR
ncbi:Nicotianamine synthase [Massarina eburnea CBS 473.64]|uniref:Nicotianamine synthase n=1 Tax=Massarina eburnea CBS 473.64 TaxID=1395130 RepID=A0A6A6SBC6_9PLEO|nr:Nicotianamine synthase [Massarina eburnea CBS 473.64]